MAIRIIMQKLTLSLFFLFLAACAKNLEERAERGDVEAQYKLARQYQDSAQGDGYYDPADMQCAIRWYELAAEQGTCKSTMQSCVYLRKRIISPRRFTPGNRII